MSDAAIKSPMAPARQKLLDAALAMIREKGYVATTVDDLCARAGVAKGSFFYHFEGKEALAVAAANYWSETTGDLFARAPYHAHRDPLDRVLGYIDFRRALLKGGIPDFTCLVGTMVQEIYDTHPVIRDVCDDSISSHAEKIETDIAEAMRERGISAGWTAMGLALHTQAVLQGAFILAKAKGGADIAISSADHLRRYIELLFNAPIKKEGKCHDQLSRNFSWIQGQPPHGSLDGDARGRTQSEGTGRHRRLGRMDGKAQGRRRR
jgi:TetR/AcrR family transcriptional repressor of nem operon